MFHGWEFVDGTKVEERLKTGKGENLSLIFTLSKVILAVLKMSMVDSFHY